MEPWKRQGAIDSLGAYPRFNGATAMEPWKSELDSLGRPKIGFNGATAMEPWKSRQERRPGDMVRFNGATAMEPWKSQAIWRGGS